MKKQESYEEEVIYVDEDGNPVEGIEGEEYEYVEVEEQAGPGGLSRALDRVFHFLDRGGSLGGEVAAGLGMGLLTVCLVFLNIQLIGNMLTADVELVNSPQNAANIEAALTYAQLYAGAVIVSVLGTLAVGIAANLPLVQVGSMGLSGALLCLVETGSGLTFENLLLVNIVAGVLYAAVVLVPGLRDAVFGAVPRPVRRGLPVATGLLLAWAALRQCGLLEPSTVSLGGGKLLAVVSGVSASTSGLGLAAIAGIVAAVALYVAQRVSRRGKPVLLSLLGGTVVYLAVGFVVGGFDTSSADSVANFGRVWLVAGSQASAATPFADSYLTYVMAAIAGTFSGIADVVSAGVDFSGYDGSAVALMASGVLCYLFGALFEAEGTLVAVGDETGVELSDEPSVRRAKLVNAVTAAVGALLGCGGVRLSAIGAGGAQDRGRSGLSSVVAAVVMLVSLFVMVVPALFATEVYPASSMNLWNYFAYGNGGFVYVIRAVVLGVADVVVACVGISLVLGLRRLSGAIEVVPALVMAVAAALTLNIVAGVACGLLVYLLMAIPARRTDSAAITAPMVVLELLLIVAVVLL